MVARTALSRLLQLAIVAAIAYFAVTQGWPYLRQRLAAAQASTPPRTIAADEAGRCMDLSDEAVEVFDDGLDPFLSPPVSETSWARYVTGVQNHIAESRRECASCAEPSCYRAMEAVEGVGVLLGQLDAAFRRDGEVPDPRERRAIILQTMEDARGL